MENPISSTLFRFVTLRSANLADENSIPLKFVIQPNSLKNGVFYTAINSIPAGMTKRERLLATAHSFVQTYETEEKIKDAYNTIYPFSIWLIRNRSSYTESEFQERISALTAITNTALTGYLWNMLFYQMIKQESFEIKELVMQLLLANHVLLKAKRGTSPSYKEQNKEIVSAKVVLPPELFDEYTGKRSENLAQRPELDPDPVRTAPDPELKKRLEVTKGKMIFQKLKILKSKLKQSEQKYRIAAQAKYDEEYLDYLSKYKGKYDQFDLDIKNARETYCAVRGTTIPYNPDDPCDRPLDVTPLDAPPFAYIPLPETTPTQLLEDLGAENYATLLALYSSKNVGNNMMMRGSFIDGDVDDELPTGEQYDNIYTLVEDASAAATQLIHQNIVVTPPVVVIPPFVVPVTTSPIYQPDDYTICGTMFAQTAGFTITLGVPDEHWSIESIDVTETKGTSVVKRNITDIVWLFNHRNNTVEISDFYYYPFPDTNYADGPILRFEINFSNGCTKTISSIPSGLRSCLKAKATGTCSVTPNPNPTNAPFIPSGFGFRDVGVAEYKRVEQTVQCYIEGEVSQIENVMAREYREKSTRLLRRVEDSTTTSNESEKEKLRDTTVTDRFEMQTEVNNVIQEVNDSSGFVNSGYEGQGFRLDAGISFANNTSQEQATNIAVTKAKEITERALERVVAKVKEERIRKITEEFEENNKHGYDNRRGNEHVVGVYRWVDKLYKNQIWNYGIRTIFEFMIPEPSRLHELGMKQAAMTTNEDVKMTPPVDPRTVIDTAINISTFDKLTIEAAQYWAVYYNAELPIRPVQDITVGDSYTINYTGGAKLADVEANSGSGKITIPEGYRAVSATGVFNAISDYRFDQACLLSLTIGNRTKTYKNNIRSYSLYLNTDLPTTVDSGSNPVEVTSSLSFSGANFMGEIPVSYTLGNHASGDISVAIKCTLTTEALNQWKQEAFTAILDAYEDAKAAYNEQKKDFKKEVETIKLTNPGFYRQIENTILKKNCISYLIDQNPLAANTYGKSNSRGTTFGDYEVNVTKDLDNYASLVKFFEQAFEWDIMSYNFYSYFWGNRTNWASLYSYDGTSDPIFRSFSQAGMARVMVTVRPGFEDAVHLYMSTGVLWKGGDIPVIGTDMYVSMADELKPKQPKKDGPAWITRVPTSLTILQAGSIGLNVVKPLPCNCDDLDDFEDPRAIPCNDMFTKPNSLIGGPTLPEEEEGEGA